MKKPDPQPLYLQVRNVLLERIETGAWKPGQALPSEFALADELSVSQGTVRKALDRLAADQLLVRHQGKGTFVAEQTPSGVLFRFFKIYDDKGRQVEPTSQDERIRFGRASRQEAVHLQIAPDADVIRITRLRLHGPTAFMWETIVLPEEVFPGLGRGGVVPNTLYDLFQKQFQVTVARADERVEPVAATAKDAQTLNVDEGTPLMLIDRVTYGLNERPIEWRVSRCHMKGLHYRAALR